MKGAFDKSTGKRQTTIAIWKSTKDKLDKYKAPGQCYNGFICQLLDVWEQLGEKEIRKGSFTGG